MARKINKPAALPAPPPPENELDVLHPERQLVFGARKVVVREYGHVEWLRLLPQAEPLVAAIASALEQGRDPTYEEALACLAQHIDALAPLVAQAANLAPEEHAALDPEQGEVLLMTWWGVNGRFFVGRALNRVAVSLREAANRKALQAAADSMATQRSSPP